MKLFLFKPKHKDLEGCVIIFFNHTCLLKLHCIGKDYYSKSDVVLCNVIDPHPVLGFNCTLPRENPINLIPTNEKHITLLS